ncbi:MAG: ABC transporter permease [Mycobacteriales bacterium]
MTSEQRVAALAEQPLTVVGARHGFLAGSVDSLRQVWLYRELLMLLVKREIKVRYKDSALGLLWTLIRPLAMLAVYYFAIGKFLGAQREIPDFAVYIFTGLTAYQLFSEIVSGCTGSILGNAGLVKKIYLPREVFPLSTVGSALFNFAVQLAVLVAATVAVGKVPTGERLLFLPLSVAVLFVWATAFGLMLAAVNVYLRDVQYLVEISLTVLFWTTPTVYSLGLVRNAVGPTVESVYLANPLAAAILGMQRVFWVAGDSRPQADNLGVRLVVMLGVGAVLLWVAQRVFARLEGNFAQEL